MGPKGMLRYLPLQRCQCKGVQIHYNYSQGKLHPMLKPKRFYQKEGFRIGLIVFGLFLWFFISFRHEIGVVWQPISASPAHLAGILPIFDHLDGQRPGFLILLVSDPQPGHFIRLAGQ